MKPTLFTIMMVLPFLCFSQYTYKNLQVNFLESNADLKNYSFQNLRLYPIYAKQSFKSQFKNVGNYMPLQEALQKKKLKITEKTNGGSVNNLTIEKGDLASGQYVFTLTNGRQNISTKLMIRE